MTAPTWTILVPTVPERGPLFARLMARVLPQLDEHEGRVRLLAWRNRGEPYLGELRDIMVDAAGTDYVSFIDDDDLVPDYYVAEVVKALAERPDHVGFKLEYDAGPEGYEIVEHSLKWSRWGRSAEGVLYRDFTHVDPIRTALAQQGRFGYARRGRAEDRKWVRQVRPAMATEVYIDKIMYHYLYSFDGSVWRRREGDIPDTGEALPAIDHPYFTWHERSV